MLTAATTVRYCSNGVFTSPLVAVQSIAMSVSACLSTRISQKQHVHTSLNFLYMLPVVWLGPPLTIVTSGFLNDVMFAHNGL